MKRLALLIALVFSSGSTTTLAAQSHLGTSVNTANIASVTFDVVGSAVQYVHVVKNGVETLIQTDASGIWKVPAGKKFVILSAEVTMNATQASSSPGLHIISTIRGTNGLQVGLPFYTFINKTELVANEVAYGASQWPSGIVIPSGLGISTICGSVDGMGINSNSYSITFFGYFS